MSVANNSNGWLWNSNGVALWSSNWGALSNPSSYTSVPPIGWAWNGSNWISVGVDAVASSAPAYPPAPYNVLVQGDSPAMVAKAPTLNISLGQTASNAVALTLSHGSLGVLGLAEERDGAIVRSFGPNLTLSAGIAGDAVRISRDTVCVDRPFVNVTGMVTAGEYGNLASSFMNANPTLPPSAAALSSAFYTLCNLFNLAGVLAAAETAWQVVETSCNYFSNGGSNWVYVQSNIVLHSLSNDSSLYTSGWTPPSISSNLIPHWFGSALHSNVAVPPSGSNPGFGFTCPALTVYGPIQAPVYMGLVQDVFSDADQYTPASAYSVHSAVTSLSGRPPFTWVDDSSGQVLAVLGSDGVFAPLGYSNLPVRAISSSLSLQSSNTAASSAALCAAYNNSMATAALSINVARSACNVATAASLIVHAVSNAAISASNFAFAPSNLSVSGTLSVSGVPLTGSSNSIVVPAIQAGAFIGIVQSLGLVGGSSNLPPSAMATTIALASLDATAVFGSNSVPVARWGSNASAWASNTSIWSSNTALSSSNCAIFGCNAAVHASNSVASSASNASQAIAHSIFASNGIPWSSNAALFGCNASVFASNLAVDCSSKSAFGSNAAFFASNLAVATEWASNASLFASNLHPSTVFSSNSSAFASNLAPAVAFSSNLFPAATFASNAAQWGCNAGVWASNLSSVSAIALAWTSNAAYAGSNASVWGSNAAYHGSNAATSSSNLVYGLVPQVTTLSNLAFALSNPSIFGSNVAHASSNPAFWGSNLASVSSNPAFWGSNLASVSSNPAFWGSNVAYESSNPAFWGSNVAHAASNASFWGSNLASVSSNPAFWGSNVAYESSNPAFWGSNVAHAASNASFWGSNLASVSSNPAFWGSNLASVSSNPAFWGSNVAYESSNPAFWGSNVAYESSNPAFWGSNMASVTSNPAFWGSNMAYVSSNPAFWGSNVAYESSNPAFWGSNMASVSSNPAFWGSNVAYESSNPAFWGSNVAYVASNPAFWGSNVASVSSNPAFWGSNVAYESSNPAFWGSNVAYVASNASFWGSNVAYVASNASFWGSNVASVSSNAAFWGSNASSWASNTSAHGSNASTFSSNAAVFSSNVSVFGSNTSTAALDVGSWASNCAGWSSNGLYSTSPASAFASNAASFASNAAYVGSNAGLFGSNASVWASNSARWSSNVGDFSSNSVVWTSNSATYGSNVGFWGSNVLGWASNATTFGSNASAWGSNSAWWSSNTAFASSNMAFSQSLVRSFNNASNASGIVFASTSTATTAGVDARFTNAQGQALSVGIASASAGAPAAVVTSTGGADLGLRASAPGVAWISGGGGGGGNPSMLFPPAGISATGTLCNVLYGVGTYVPSSSSAAASNWIPFSGSNPDGMVNGAAWTSAASYYSTGGTHGQATGISPVTVADGGSNTYLGEWLQLEAPGITTPTAYTIVPQLTSQTGQPAAFALVGSYDGGISWTTLDNTYASQVGAPYSPPDTRITLSIPPPASVLNLLVSAVRLVVTRVTSAAASGTLVPVSVCAMSIEAPPALATLGVGGTPSAIVATGNMGIGTVSPQQRLDVRGCAVFSQGVGVGMTTEPLYQLQLTRDSAAKPSTNTWTVYSDRRLKNDKGRADLKRCYDIVKTLPLSRFQWKDGTHSEKAVPDRSKLGWYAQDVRAVFPKSVETNDAFGISDCLTMNSDQIIAVLYGTVQLMQSRIETLEKNYSKLHQQL